MAPFTEFIHIELSHFVDVNNPEFPESAVWQRAFDELASQPGCVNIQWAHRVENLEWLVLKIDWWNQESYAAPYSHKRFGELIAPLSIKKAVIRDAAIYKPVPACEILSAASCIEILTLLIPSSIPGEEALALEQACIKVSTSTLHRPHGVKAVAHAWLTNEIYHPDSPTGKAKALRFLLAWPSLEEHKAVMATEEFKAAMSPIKEKCLPALYGRGMFHAEFAKENQLSKSA